MRHLEQSIESLKLDHTHACRIRLRASQNKSRDPKRNKQLIESLSIVIEILTKDAFDSPLLDVHKNGSAKKNGAAKKREVRT